MTRRPHTILAASTLLLAGILPARASGDSCDAGWSLDFSAKPPCSNIAALVPGNDTRANLVLLLADRHGQPRSAEPAPKPTLDWPELRERFDGGPAEDGSSTYASGEGSRCLSNEGGEKAFGDALSAAGALTAQERADLAAARASLKPACSAPATGQPLSSTVATATSGMTTPLGRAYAAYLRAAEAFYAGRFAEAATGFAGLATSSDPWLADTAGYMLARNAVNLLQVDAFDQYGSFKGAEAVDKGRAQEAEAGLESYLRAHPDGRYAASARGLLRRVDWLSGRTDRLTARYEALLAQPPATRGVSDAALADEIDNKLIPVLRPGMARDPILLAVMDLMALRKAGPGETQAPRPDLEAQRTAFASDPDLHGLLVAADAFYGDADPRAVIQGVPDDARRRGGSRLWFARQFLRGMALEAAGDRNARGFWKELIPSTNDPMERGTAELAFALDVERRNDVDAAIASGSPIANAAIRTILLTRDANPALLRSRASEASAPTRERQVALLTLLRRDLAQGAYADFLSDVALVPPGAPTGTAVEVDPTGDAAIPLGLFVKGETAGEIGCPALATTVTVLARDPGSARGKLCLGEWIRLNGFDPDRYVSIQKGSLGSSGVARDRDPSRGRLYAEVIADPGAPADARAYALFRAVKCYESSGENGCGGKAVAKPERQRWYNALRREYPGSRWARGLRYWW